MCVHGSIVLEYVIWVFKTTHTAPTSHSTEEMMTCLHTSALLFTGMGSRVVFLWEDFNSSL